ncbi:hypothetical protein [Holospora curviuscula]|uniref:Uncharacterized protein n=1 Tax=Holospora curviuscula TaxID=1082868 RepID=A0A2S5R821_9PROT|nr:hypothetical protein [Holospora curviuscula]PPE03437.1 hypothetical protein HCUR_01113 [Holospora curviuscula]
MQKKIFSLLFTLLAFDFGFAAPPAPGAPLAPPPGGPAGAPGGAPAVPPPQADDLFGPPAKGGGGNAGLDQRMDAIEGVFTDICKNFSKGGEGLGSAPNGPGTPPGGGEGPSPGGPGGPAPS